MWRLGDLRRKEVVNIRDGTRLGFVTDVEIDESTGASSRWWCRAPPACLACLAARRITSSAGTKLKRWGRTSCWSAWPCPTEGRRAPGNAASAGGIFPIEAFLQGGFRWSCCRKRNLRKMEGKGACAGEGCAPSACFPKFTSQVFFSKNFSFEERCGMIRGRIL